MRFVSAHVLVALGLAAIAAAAALPRDANPGPGPTKEMPRIPSCRSDQRCFLKGRCDQRKCWESYAKQCSCN